MIVFPPDHPLGRQQRHNLREKLLPADDREELVRRQYGELIRPTFTALLDAKVEELAARYEKAWGGVFAHMMVTSTRASPTAPRTSTNSVINSPSTGEKWVIGNDLKIIGQGLKIISRGVLQVDGEIEGDVQAAEVVVGEKGKVTG